MFDDVSLRSKLSQYESYIVDYFAKEKGHTVIISDDSTFTTLLRQTFSKQLAVQAADITLVSSLETVEKQIKIVFSKHERVLVFVERMYKNEDLSYLVRKIKKQYTSSKVVVLMAEPKHNQLVFMHEIGCDNVIAKPISINTLIEKIAFTIKPQNKLGQLIDVAKKMIASGEYAQALSATNAIMDIKPNSAIGLIVAGDAYVGLKEFDRARKSYDRAAENAPMYLEPLKKQVALFALQSDLTSKIDYLKKLDALSPLNIERKLEIGEAYMEQGTLGEAEIVFDNAIKQAAKESHKAAANVATEIAELFGTDEPEQASRYFKRALAHQHKSSSPQDVSLYISLGIVLRKQGKWEEAISEYLQALKVFRNDANIYYNIAVAAGEGGDYRQAGDALRRVLAINKHFAATSASVAYNMGVMLKKCSEKRLAYKMLETCLAMKPNHAGAAHLMTVLE